METKQEGSEGSDFPREIGKPAWRALVGAGYLQLDQLTEVREADLLKLHGMGPKALGILRRTLEARGLSFARAKEATKGAPEWEK
jgi:hypothetical protein